MVKKYITSGKGLDSLFIEINRKISRKRDIKCALC